MSCCTAQQSSWLSDTIAVALPGVSSHHLEQLFPRVADEFLRRSGAWIVIENFRPNSRGEVVLDFTADQARMAWIYDVFSGGRRLSHTSRPPLHRYSGAPFMYANTPDPEVIQLLGDDHGNVEARCALAIMPSPCRDGQTATQMPDWLFERYREVLRNSMMYELLMEMGKPYTNVKVAMHYGKLYRSGAVQARNESRRGMGMHEAEFTFPRSGGWI